MQHILDAQIIPLSTFKYLFCNRIGIFFRPEFLKKAKSILFDYNYPIIMVELEFELNPERFHLRNPDLILQILNLKIRCDADAEVRGRSVWNRQQTALCNLVSVYSLSKALPNRIGIH